MPPPMSLRQWNPSKPGNASRIKPQVWRQFRNKITTLYHQGCTKKEILAALESDVLANERSFHPTMGQLVPQMKVWGLFADQRDSRLAIEQTGTPVTARQLSSDNGWCAQKDVAINQNKVLADAADEAATLTPQARYNVQMDYVLKITKEQARQTSMEKGAIVDRTAFTDDTLRFELLDEKSSLSNLKLRDAGGHLPQESLLLYSTTCEESKDANRHGDAPSTSDSNHVVDNGTQGASNPSFTPPSTYAETSSMDDKSLDGGDIELEKLSQPAGRLQHSNSNTFGSVRDYHPDIPKTPISRVASVFIDDGVLPSKLLALWPGFVDLQSLTQSQLHEIRGAATSLAAASAFDDAFDLFYVEWRYWQACEWGFQSCNRDWPCNRCRRASHCSISRNEPIRRMVTATVDCARTCRVGRRQEIAQQILNQVLTTLLKQRLGNSLESALLQLYLLSLLEICAPKQVSQSLRYAAIGKVHRCGGSSFTILLPEIQDREYLFMAQALERPGLRSLFGGNSPVGSGGLSPLLLKNVEQQIADPKHLADCEDMTRAIEKLLKWYEDVIQKNSGLLDTACVPLLAKAPFQPRAAWLFYCFCACETIIGPAIQNKLEIFEVPLCTHGKRRLRFDTPLALAVITESFRDFGTDWTKWHLTGSRFSGYCIGEIDAILKDKTTRCRDIIETYLSRINDMPSRSSGLDALDGAYSVLVKDFIKAAIQALRSSSQIDYAALTRTLSMAFPSTEVPERSNHPCSAEGSIRSSLNTIRSSMSFDTKQMLEMKLRLRRPTSPLSIRSKDTGYSNATSINSRGSDTFEAVTGMPASGPAADLGGEPVRYKDTVMVERIDEEMGDVDRSV